MAACGVLVGGSSGPGPVMLSHGRKTAEMAKGPLTDLSSLLPLPITEYNPALTALFIPLLPLWSQEELSIQTTEGYLKGVHLYGRHHPYRDVFLLL